MQPVPLVEAQKLAVALRDERRRHAETEKKLNTATAQLHEALAEVERLRRTRVIRVGGGR